MFSSDLVQKLAEFYKNDDSCVVGEDGLEFSCFYSEQCSKVRLDRVLPFSLALFAEDVEGPDGNLYCQLEVEPGTETILGQDYLNNMYVRLTPDNIMVAPLSTYNYTTYLDSIKASEEEIDQEKKDEFAKLSAWGKVQHLFLGFFSMNTIAVTLYDVILGFEMIAFLSMDLIISICLSPFLFFAYPSLAIWMFTGDHGMRLRDIFTTRMEGDFMTKFFHNAFYWLYKFALQGSVFLRLVGIVPWGT